MRLALLFALVCVLSASVSATRSKGGCSSCHASGSSSSSAAAQSNGDDNGDGFNYNELGACGDTRTPAFYEQFHLQCPPSQQPFPCEINPCSLANANQIIHGCESSNCKGCKAFARCNTAEDCATGCLCIEDARPCRDVLTGVEHSFGDRQVSKACGSSNFMQPARGVCSEPLKTCYNHCDCQFDKSGRDKGKQCHFDRKAKAGGSFCSAAHQCIPDGYCVVNEDCTPENNPHHCGKDKHQCPSGKEPVFVCNEKSRCEFKKCAPAAACPQ